MDSYPSNVILLLLQIILHRQQSISHKDKKKDYNLLLVEPVIDTEVLKEFQNHKLVKLHAPDMCNIQLRSLRLLVNEIFEKGIPEVEGNIPVNIVSLANYYYAKRIKQIEDVELPRLRNEMKSNLG
ncbi:hypothetical protein Kpol_1055p87 [Vanderwaltozyma polyspora DSM 70294]|uniref:Uncharacterized protein n=1 Tax=Vanderwaltozyma polyspora (strain ATCC 22028 / DSM 70294 / BCRC 21397 / CBS 2163 / NBRC 10782 / NRRL Y-8283 / UCD 57-17) TaxID=436907 RepID=A7TGG0_VANPO|nr:uncharacterized protein Kpol_1055p87 [Vanderwaltozyma polyspora DSM 70294]EDO18730.1 hypothetical protein Kpol_1055p87 [Vanderwaltozyma polyspora DSM 70294]